MINNQFSFHTRRIWKQYAVPGVFFSLANLFNFAQTGNLLAESIAGANLVAATYFATKNNFKTAMRVTSGCTLAVGVVLATTILRGASPTLIFPAAAAFCFGIGNALASMDKPRISPAVFYGLGYTATALTIAGGFTILSNPTVAALTAIGIAETAYALSMSGKTHNQAKPFVGVAAGTIVFAATGFLTGNMLGACTGLSACAGELSMAIMKQKQYNADNPGWAQEQDWPTAPLRAAMKRGWLSPLPEQK